MGLSLLLLSMLTAAPAGATVTLPLADALPLLSPAKEVPGVRPPVDALLVHQTLKGKPGQDGLTIEARFEVEVLADKTWSQVPLLPLGPDVVVQHLDAPAAATIAPRGGQLVFFSAKAGSYAFDVRLLVRARAEGAERSAVLGALPSSGVVPLTLQADPGIFEVLGPDEVFPAGGSYTVKWRTRAPVAQAQKREPPPPLEPRIKELVASWVTTLEGRVTARVSYRLHLDRPQRFEVTVPEGQRLESVRVNGQVVPLAVTTGTLTLAATPLRLGETEGTIELRLSQNIGVFHLAGSLRVCAMVTFTNSILLGNSTDRLTIAMDAQGVGGWCQVHLHGVGGSRPLGAESLRYIAAHLLAFLRDTTPGQRWVLSLSELHVSAYGEHVEGRVVLHFQDADGRMFAQMVLTLAEKSQWMQELSQHAGF